jgi:hypothetical protein
MCDRLLQSLAVLPATCPWHLSPKDLRDGPESLPASGRSVRAGSALKTNCLMDLTDSKWINRNFAKRTAGPKLLKRMNLILKILNRWDETTSIGSRNRIKLPASKTNCLSYIYESKRFSWIFAKRTAGPNLLKYMGLLPRIRQLVDSNGGIGCGEPKGTSGSATRECRRSAISQDRSKSPASFPAEG